MGRLLHYFKKAHGNSFPQKNVDYTKAENKPNKGKQPQSSNSKPPRHKFYHNNNVDCKETSQASEPDQWLARKPKETAAL